VLRGIEKLRVERDRLVGWVLNAAAERVTVRSGDRVGFRYKDQNRVGTVLGPHHVGFRMREDGDTRPKVFNREQVNGFSFLASEAQV
jgi:hypothetical protein